MERFKCWCSRSIPLLFLVLALPVFSQDSGTSDTEFTNSTSRPIRHTAPLVVDGEGGLIGYYLGTSTTHSMNGLTIKGFEILTAAGYTSVIQANGAIGFIGTVLFSKAACQGKKYVAAVDDELNQSYLPGYVLAFGTPEELYFISKHASIVKTKIVAKSVMSESGRKCFDVNEEKYVYPLIDNDSAETGLSNLSYFSTSIETPASWADKNQGRPGTLRPGQSTSVSPNVEQMEMMYFECSPGCESDMISNGTCEQECNTEACGYDSNDCNVEEIDKAIRLEGLQCAPYCEPDDIGDGFCDKHCNNSSCNYDGGDCQN